MSENTSASVEKLTIFIVDDTLANIDVLSQILEEENFEIAFAESGEEALENIPKTMPDIILMDVMMPGIDGFETCKRLKENNDVKDIPLIFVTAKHEAQDILDALQAGAVDYIAKPVQREEVLIKINTHLQNKVLLHQLEESEKIANLGRVVATVAHEVNTPIGNAITAASEFSEMTSTIKKHLDEKSLGKKELSVYIETAAKAANIITSNLERAGTLISSFKSVSSKQSTEDKQSFNLNKYLHDIVVTMEPTLKKAKAKLEIDCDEDITLVSFPGSLSNIIINFINNALIHAFPDNHDGLMRIVATTQGDSVKIEFHDNGQGIEEKVVKKIFEPFFTTKLTEGGTGLGLHVVYTTVKDVLSGSVTCKSKVGEGTVFTIILPKEV